MHSFDRHRRLREPSFLPSQVVDPIAAELREFGDPRRRHAREEAFVFDRALRRFRDAIMSGEYTITPHGQEELRSDDLTLFDIESCVLTGCIVDRQWDSRRNEWKYLIEGRSVAGTACVLVVKWSRAGRLSVLTAFALDG